jgi:hypothetical protein
LSLPEKAITIYKFIYDRLPTHVRENKNYSYRDKQCNQCQSDHEDEDHIVKCFLNQRQKARKEWVTELNSYLSQNHTPPRVKHIILQNLNQFLESTNDESELEIDNTDIQKAQTQQSIIGWRHFLRGRLSINWGKAVSNHLFREKLYHISAEKWAADLLLINWKHILKIWRERCIEVHGNSPNEIEQKTMNRCLKEIRHIQNVNQNLHNTNHEWILEDIEELQKHNSKNYKRGFMAQRSSPAITRTTLNNNYSSTVQIVYGIIQTSNLVISRLKKEI